MINAHANTKHSSIKNVVFDFGGVLVDWDPLRHFRNRFGSELELKEFIQFMMPYNLLLDAGCNSDVVLGAVATIQPKWAKQVLDWDNGWINMFGGEKSDTVALVKALYHNKIPLYAITNWQANKVYYLHENLSFMPYFVRGVIVSGQEGIVKPDVRIYQLLASRYQIDLSESLFIDDNPINVVGANSVGMTGFHFKDAAQLEIFLKEQHLL